MDMHTQQYFKWTTNRAYRAAQGTLPQCHAAAWVGGERRGERMHVDMHGWSIQGSPEMITILLIGYILIENKV